MSPQTESSSQVPAPRRAGGTGFAGLGAHIPPLDGLRGLAIIFVLLHHFTPGRDTGYFVADKIYWEFAEALWCGVDLFFVLSGFLITGILVDAKGSPHYFRNFYVRRTLRIFPLYYGTLLLIVVLTPILAPSPAQTNAILSNQAWLWSYCANVLLAIREGWVLESDLWDMNNFWSLSVEEHFYLVWPAVVFVSGRKTLKAICVGCIAAAVGVRIGLMTADFHPIAAYVLTPARIDALAVGGYLALLVRGPREPQAIAALGRRIAATCGLLVVALIAWKHELNLFDPVVQRVGYTLLALFFGGVLILALGWPTSNPLHRACNLATLRFFGKYSYGLYVLQSALEPLFREWFPRRYLSEAVGSRLAGGILYMILAIGSCVVAAWLSWHLYEKHFLKLKARFAG